MDIKLYRDKEEYVIRVQEEGGYYLIWLPDDDYCAWSIETSAVDVDAEIMALMIKKKLHFVPDI